jgi:hypothetical protein
MSSDNSWPRIRWLVGRHPRIWVGAVWCVLGLVWFALAVFVLPGQTWELRIAFGSIFLVLGGVQLLVAVHDRIRRQGTYAAPTLHQSESES